MKIIFTIIIFMLIIPASHSQNSFHLSEIIPEKYLALIKKQLSKTENPGTNMIIPGLQFYENISESTNLSENGLLRDYTCQFWNGVNWQNDSSETYLYNSNDLLSETMVRNWMNNNWRDSYRYNRYYDSALRLSLLIEQDKSTGTWIDSLKYVYEYNNQDQLHTKTSYHWLNSNWENFRLTTSTYNNNLHIQDINQNWDGSSWVNSGRTTYTYNIIGNPTSSTLSIWIFGTWINLLRIVLSYNSDGLLEEFKLQWWDFISGWANLTRVIFYYDNNFNIYESIAQDWNSGTSSWKDYARITLTYNQNNLVNKSLEEVCNQNNSWERESLITYSYDANLNLEQKLTQIWNSGNWVNSNRELFNYIITSVNEISNLANDYFLSQNYPNPFNPSTKIKFSLPSSGYTTLKIYNALGIEIIVLMEIELSAGTYEIKFNAERLPSGVYFYKLESEGFTATKKMILVK